MLILVLGVAAVGMLTISQQRRILYPLRRAADASGLWRSVGGEQVWLEGGGVRSEAWFLPARGASRGPTPLLIFTHGNGELIDDWPREFEEPRGWGVSALLVEYPGYGRSAGSPSETSISNAIVAAYDWAKARPDVDPRRIVAYGRSLGGGAACALARQREVAALVLESTFTSVPALAARQGVPRFLIVDKFDNGECVAAFRKPILLVHGEQDSLVPVTEARALHAAAPQSELVLFRDCGHNDCPRPWPKL